MPDFSWMSCGGCLIDGTGDLALATVEDSLHDMIVTRLKAALDGWQLYRIGADLEALVGNTVTDELEIAVRRQVEMALSRDLLPRGGFQVKTLVVGNLIQVFVFVQESLVATIQVTAS